MPKTKTYFHNITKSDIDFAYQLLQYFGEQYLNSQDSPNGNLKSVHYNLSQGIEQAELRLATNKGETKNVSEPTVPVK